MVGQIQTITSMPFLDRKDAPLKEFPLNTVIWNFIQGWAFSELVLSIYSSAERIQGITRAPLDRKRPTNQRVGNQTIREVSKMYDKHYSDVIMGTMIQITGVSIVCSAVFFFRRRSKKTPKLPVTGLCEGNSPVKDSNASHARHLIGKDRQTNELGIKGRRSQLNVR